MQAITTKYQGPGNRRGSTIIAKSASGERLIHHINNRYSASENHAHAAQALASRLFWNATYHGAYIADSTMAWVPSSLTTDTFVADVVENRK